MRIENFIKTEFVDLQKIFIIFLFKNKFLK